MSYKERSTWISLAILVYIWLEYFSDIFSLQSAGQLTVEAVNSLLLTVVVKTIILEIILQIVLAIIDHKDANYAADERDNLINLHGSRNGYAILSLGAFMIVFHTVFPSIATMTFLPSLPFESLSLPNEYNIMHLVIIFALIAEVVKFCTQLFFYRRGF